MKGKFSTKAIVITILTILLLGAAVTGTVLFLKDNGEAAAKTQEEQNTNAILPVAGDETQNQGTESTENGQEGTTETTTQTGTVSGTTPTQATRTITATPDASTIEVENDKITRTLAWNNLIVSNDSNSFDNSINYNYLTLKINYLFEDESIAAEAYETAVPRGEEYSIESPVITGYVADIPVVEGKTDETYIEYTVTYTAETYNIVIDLNGGTLPEGKENPTTYTIEDEDIVIVNPEKEGYTFAGWEDEEGNNLGTNVTIEAGSTGDKELTATWTPEEYTLTLNGNGGTYRRTTYTWWGPQTTYEPTTTKTITYDSAYGTLEEPTRNDYMFVGWNTKPDGSGETITSATIVSKTEDHTIYAQWVSTRYTLTLDGNGGTYRRTTYTWWGPQTTYEPTTTKTVTYNRAYGTMEEPEREGYTFAGWNTNKDGSGETITSQTIVSKLEDHTIYAQWTPEEYTLTLDGNGGTYTVVHQDQGWYWWQTYETQEPTTTKTVTYDSAYGTLEEPKRTGYTFAGWNTKQDGSGNTVTAETIVKTAGNHTIYAQWTPEEYTLTLDGNGGTYRRTTYTWWGPQTTYEPTTTKTITYNSAYGTMEEPEREGYTFAGWNTKQNGTGETITSATIVNRLENHTIYAQWQINQYTITFDSNGGSAVAPITQDYGTTITAPADPTREGYTFTGWSEEIPSTMPAESITVTAQWRINQYTITFDSNGGSTVAPITQDYGTTITAPADPTREGYTFAGWSEEIPATMPATDKTITASWTINSYTITFDSNGGSAVAPITQDYGTTITAPADPTREGYTFAGWSEEIPATMPATDKTLTANWTKNKYNYTIEYYYENLLDVPNKVELNGKYFTKNRTEISADEYEYESEITTFVDNNTILGYELFAIRPVDSENNLLLVIGDTAAGAENVIKVYYNLASYTATFNGNGGTPATSSIEKTYGEALGTLPTVTREGYTFAGWYTESTGGTKITEATTMPLNGATYYAHWDEETFDVTFVIGVDGDYSKKPDNPRISATIDSSSISIGSSYTIQLKNSEVLEYTASADYYHPISNGSGTLTNITEDTTIYINFTLNNEVQGHTTFNLNTSTTKLGKRISGYYTIDYAAISGSIYDIVNYFVIDEPSAYELDKVTKIDNLVIQGKNEATVVHWTAEQNIKTAIGDSIHFEDVYTLGDYSDPGYTVNCTTTFSSPISLKGKTLELTIDQLNVYCNLKQITINYWYIPKNV